MAESMNLFSVDDNDEHIEDNQELFIKGKVAATFFESPDSFFKVLLVKISETNISDWHEDEIVITGNFADIAEESEYQFYGELVDHPKYGKQFKSDNYQSTVPTSKEGLVEYLSGDNFPGVGKQTAKRMVDALGTNLISDVLENNSLLNRAGLSDKQKSTVLETLNKNNGMEQVIIGLNSYGFGSSLSSAIYNKYKGDTLKVIQENPYKLVEDIDGIGFKKADDIAKQMGMSANNPGRIRAGLISALKTLSLRNGDTYTQTGPILEETLKLLNNGNAEPVSGEDLSAQFLELAKNQKIVGEEDRVYLKELYDDEWRIAEHISRIIKNPVVKKFDDETIDKKIRLIEKKLNISYDESQTNALKQAIKSQMFLLTGGPGTGKTTIIKGIIYLYAYLNDLSLDINKYKEREFPILLAAPTGRAAKRMQETTGIPASTIHRLLGLNGYEDSDEGTQDIEGGLLIVDEMSMVDTFLFRALVRAIPNQMKVVFVGDKDQLPSVGPGQVFTDLLNSKRIDSMQLTTIYRQDSNSTIIPLAHSIQQGKLPDDFNDKQSDRSFIPCNANQMSSVIEQIVKRAKQKGFSATDIQVLSPMYRGNAGVNHLNEVIQQIMNPNNTDNQVEYRGIHYRLGDKILQLVNSPEDNVFNGDIGQIIDIEKGSKQSLDKITVAFDQSEVTYQRKDWIQITLAYCTTIHKAQGSEFKMVILPIVPQFTKMLKKNLLYTAITRASDTLIMIGDYNSFLSCAQSESDNRNTSLMQRIQSLLDGEVKPVTTSVNDQSSMVKEVAEEKKAQAPVDNKPVEKLKADSVSDTKQNNMATDEDDQSPFDEATFDDKPKSYRLTKDMILLNQVDPMIGMHGIKP
ncbi:ATP-dependent RecD-like DNA helicase [Apilactobacillus kunkeei]|nr:ATP-dependent RecD-like DNA helicase [Apilactobacillus kunkeei]CAI2681939.1 ATP-dependent RecD-like DNA helicase [Apilactobacillus kunkeei]CAI2682107.1 ATP-dependent RecD-like DNA helicase [Apilactobacillus kunkeei]CAI2694775.1 ATP-dependent RecD-like DNA helicase [Apilactobacillus kunkeei]